MSLTISQVNGLNVGEFARIIGPAFENSQWIAKSAFAKKPFSDLAGLHRALCETVKSSDETMQLGLIRAHPDLAGKLARDGKLTHESTGEQAAAGLDQLSPEEAALFQKQNAIYKSKFGFPFVICARINKKAAILAGFQSRLQNSREQEIETALEEIFKIAELRLRDLVQQ